jgi:hypothetical protein
LVGIFTFKNYFFFEVDGAGGGVGFEYCGGAILFFSYDGCVVVLIGVAVGFGLSIFPSYNVFSK